MPTIGKFTTNKSKAFAMNNANKATMAGLFQTSPQLASDMMIELMAQHRGKSLEYNLMKLGVKEFDRDDEYYWQLIGSSQRNIELIEARVGGVPKTTGDNLGADGAEFELVFGEDWFYEGMVIVGELPDIYQMMITKIHMEGVNNAVCTCVMVGGNTGGIPVDEVLAGKRFSSEGYSPVSDTASRERFGGNMTTPTDMRGEFSTIRYGHKVPGTAGDYIMTAGCKIMDDSGSVKEFKAWMPYVQYKIEQEFSDAKNRLLMYAKSNRRDDGLYLNKDHKTGYALKMGSGFREQMEVSNTIFYPVFSIKLIEDILFDLSESKLEFSDRLFIMKTGERGAAQFSKAVAAMASGWSTLGSIQPTDGNPAVIQKTTSELNSNALSANSGQFVEWRAPNGVIVRVEVDPIYDDKGRNKLKHPDGGVAESYRYDIFYIGTPEDANMKIAKVKGKWDRRGFQSGPFGNPFTGETSTNFASYDEDSAKMHMQCTLGAIMYDSSKSASLIPNIMQ